jgi:hypothetical protein
VALVGFVDSAIARHTDPPLTSVRQSTQEMGRTLARLLLEEIATRSSSRRHRVLATNDVRISVSVKGSTRWKPTARPGRFRRNYRRCTPAAGHRRKGSACSYMPSLDHQG